MGGLLKLGEGVLFQHYHNLHQRSLLEMSKKSGILKMMLREFKPSCLNKEVSDWHRGELLDFLKFTAGVDFPNQGVLIFAIMTLLTVSRLDANRLIFIISWKTVAKGLLESPLLCLQKISKISPFPPIIIKKWIREKLTLGITAQSNKWDLII